MQIALFVESKAEDLNGLPATHQSLLISTGKAHYHFSRISNGSRGRGQVWVQSPIENLPSNPIVNVPVGVSLTERDCQLLIFGQITNVAIKALYANEKAQATIVEVSHKEIVTDLMNRLISHDVSLNGLVTDYRTTTGLAEVIVNPIEEAEGVSQEIADMPIEAVDLDSLDTPMKYEEVEQVQLSNNLNELSLNMITIPDKKWGKSYINRKFGKQTDWDIYDKALKRGVNVLLEGGAGSGKTISVQSYASIRNMRYFNVSSNNGIDPSQLFGRWIPNPNPSNGKGQYVWQDGAVTLLVRHGGVLLLNEVNFLPARVSTVLFSLLDYRREIQLLENGGEVIKAHPNLLIVADMNMGYKGTQDLNEAFNDRFDIKLEFPYDRTIEMKVVGNRALLDLADQLRDQYDKEEITKPISTRALVGFMANAKDFDVDFAIMSFCNSFPREERAGVRLACDTHKDNIAREMNVAIQSHPIMENEEYTSEVFA